MAMATYLAAVVAGGRWTTGTRLDRYWLDLERLSLLLLDHARGLALEVLPMHTPMRSRDLAGGQGAAVRARRRHLCAISGFTRFRRGLAILPNILPDPSACHAVFSDESRVGSNA
jgi:hypothetical protein